MVARLEARLAQSPDDLQGWLMLGRSRAVLGDTPAAVEAFRRAQALAADDPGALGGLAEALTGGAGGMVTPEAKTPVHEAGRGRAPRPPRRVLSGLGRVPGRRASRPRSTAGATCSRRARPTRPGGRRWRRRIQAAAKELKLDPATVLARTSAPPATAAPAVPQPSAEDVARAAAMAARRPDGDDPRHGREAPGPHGRGWQRCARAGSGSRSRARCLAKPTAREATFREGARLHPDEPALLKGYAGRWSARVRSRHRPARGRRSGQRAADQGRGPAAGRPRDLVVSGHPRPAGRP